MFENRDIIVVAYLTLSLLKRLENDHPCDRYPADVQDFDRFNWIYKNTAKEEIISSFETSE